MKNRLEKCVFIGFVTNEFFMKIYDYKHIFNEKIFFVILSLKMAS